MNNTQLSSAISYNVNNIRFSKPEERKIPNSNMSYKLIRLSTKNDDGSVGDLVFSTDTVFSYGLQESRGMGGNGALTGYTFPLCLHNREGPTTEQAKFVETFNNIVEHCKKHLVNTRDSIERFDLDIHDLKRFNPLYYKRVNGKIVEGRGPMLYAKVLIKKNPDRTITIKSLFQDESTGKDMDPADLMRKLCHTQAILKIESIFIGSKISLQVKLWESMVRLVNTGRKRFLKPRVPTSGAGALSTLSLNTTPSTNTNDISDDDSSEEEDSPVVVKQPVKPPPKTTKKTAAKKKAAVRGKKK